MALLFLSAKDHRISSRRLEGMREEYGLHDQTPWQVLSFYQTRVDASAARQATPAATAQRLSGIAAFGSAN